MTLLFGARQQQDLYCLEQIQKIAKHWPNTFNFVPVLSQEADDSAWQGQRGHITDLLGAYIDNSQITDSQIYACGPPALVDAISTQAIELGIKSANIFADKFTDRSTR